MARRTLWGSGNSATGPELGFYTACSYSLIDEAAKDGLALDPLGHLGSPSGSGRRPSRRVRFFGHEREALARCVGSAGPPPVSGGAAIWITSVTGWWQWGHLPMAGVVIAGSHAGASSAAPGRDCSRDGCPACLARSRRRCSSCIALIRSLIRVPWTVRFPPAPSAPSVSSQNSADTGRRPSSAWATTVAL